MIAVRFAQFWTAVMAGICLIFGWGTVLFPAGFLLGLVSFILWGLIGYVGASERVEQQIEDALSVPTYPLTGMHYHPITNAELRNEMRTYGFPDRYLPPNDDLAFAPVWPHENGAPE